MSSFLKKFWNPSGYTLSGGTSVSVTDEKGTVTARREESIRNGHLIKGTASVEKTGPSSNPFHERWVREYNESDSKNPRNAGEFVKVPGHQEQVHVSRGLPEQPYRQSAGPECPPAYEQERPPTNTGPEDDKLRTKPATPHDGQKEETPVPRGPETPGVQQQQEV